jgi:hypothetical protein
MALRGFYLLHFRFEVGLSARIVVTLGVGFPTSCPVVSRGSPTLSMASFDGVASIGVATLGVGFQRHVQWHPEARLRYTASVGSVATLDVGVPT